jgi:branched-chain amino acid transport system ATP-binding protein
MLVVENLHVYYGVIHAIKGVSFGVNEGEIVTLIGSNGAGKSTILKTISGLLKQSEGDIMFKGESLTKYDPHQIVELGLSQVPEGRRVFPGLTVLENLQMGAYTRKSKTEINEDLDTIFKRFPRLFERRSQLAGTLSGGEQQMLAMGRALMSRPKILLLDEPSMGLAPILVDEIFNIIKDINDTGTTILLVEQNANRALHVSHKGYVLETGKIIASGDAKDLLNDEKVKAAYLSA